MKLPALRPAVDRAATLQDLRRRGPVVRRRRLQQALRDAGPALLLPLSGVPIYYRHCASCDFLYTDAFDDWSIEDFRAHIYNDEYAMADPEYAQKRPRDNASLRRDSSGASCGPRIGCSISAAAMT